MKHQLQTIREFIESAHEGEWASYVDRDAALTALSELERMAGEQEPVAWINPKTGTVISEKEKTMWHSRCGGMNSQGTNDDNMKAYAAAHTEPCFATPPAQQPQRITPAELAKRIERGEKWQLDEQPVGRVDGDGHVTWFAPIPEGGANLYAAQQPQAECRNCGGEGKFQMYGPAWDCRACNGTGKQPQAEPVFRDMRDMANAVWAEAEAVQRAVVYGPIPHDYGAAPQQAEVAKDFDAQLREVAKRAITQQAEAVPSDVVRDAELFRLAVRKGLLTIHSEHIATHDPASRCSWMEGHDKACDISNDAAMAQGEKP